MYKPVLYASVNGLQRQDASDISEEFIDELAEMSGRCLDIGSGSCDVVVDFILPKLNSKANIVCSDISGDMMDFARKKYKDNDRMSFAKLNIGTPDLPEDLVEQFDHVTSFYCLHWCQDIRQVFENIFNLLKPGGTTLLVFSATTPLMNAYPILGEIAYYQPYMEDVDRHIPIYQNSERPRETVKDLLKDVGFNVCHFSRREVSYVFQTPFSLRDLLLALDPFIDRMPADIRERYTHDLFKEVTKRCITFNKRYSNENEYSILFSHKAFIGYLKKPPSN